VRRQRRNHRVLRHSQGELGTAQSDTFLMSLAICLDMAKAESKRGYDYGLRRHANVRWEIGPIAQPTPIQNMEPMQEPFNI
jgi:hypothetical protein